MKKYISFLIYITCFLTGCNGTANKNMVQQKSNQKIITLFPLANYNQDITYWINPDNPHYNTPLLKPEIQQKHFKLFYEHVYGELSPWSRIYVNQILHKTSPEDIVTGIKDECIKFNNRGKIAKEITYGENFRPYAPVWADKISDNINITQFDNLNYKPDNRAIAVSNLYLRSLPTNDVNFYSNKIAGQGYPFDNLQMSSVWAGTPIYIIGTTKDKNWSLIMVSDIIGWVESNGIAKVSGNFVNKWQKAVKLKLAAITCTQTSIVDLEGHFLFTSYIGSVFPVVHSNSKTERKLMVPALKNNHAIIKYSMVPVASTKIMPVAPTQHNMATLLSSLIGRPYGWGNMYFYNDCSAELKNLFTPFGIWLPRNSKKQLEFVHKNFHEVDMSSAFPEERLTYLIQYGKPFFTIIYIEGHVFMYIGNHIHPYKQDGSLIAMTYQNIWGLKPMAGEDVASLARQYFCPCYCNTQKIRI